MIFWRIQHRQATTAVFRHEVRIIDVINVPTSTHHPEVFSHWLTRTFTTVVTGIWQEFLAFARTASLYKAVHTYIRDNRRSQCPLLQALPVKALKPSKSRKTKQNSYYVNNYVSCTVVKINYSEDYMNLWACLLVLLDVFDTVFQVSQSFRRIIPVIKKKKTTMIQQIRPFKNNDCL